VGWIGAAAQLHGEHLCCSLQILWITSGAWESNGKAPMGASTRGQLQASGSSSSSQQPATSNKQRSMGNDALTSRMTCLLDGNAETRVAPLSPPRPDARRKARATKLVTAPPAAANPTTPPVAQHQHSSPSSSSLHFTSLYTPHTTLPNPIQSTHQPPTWVASSLSEATSRCTLALAAVKRRTANPPPGTELSVPQRRLSTTSTTPSSTPTSVCAVGPSCLRSAPV
jgi:hypothetical protein